MSNISAKGRFASGEKNLPKHEQPREKLIEKGVENLRDNELMAIFAALLVWTGDISAGWKAGLI